MQKVVPPAQLVQPLLSIDERKQLSKEQVDNESGDSNAITDADLEKQAAASNAQSKFLA